MKVSKAQIDRFLKNKQFAIAGVSRNEKKFGHILFEDMTNAGYTIIPINPNMDELMGVKCYASIDELPKGIESLLIATPKSNTDEVLQKAIELGIPNIWVNGGAETKDSETIAKNLKTEIIIKKCIYMFVEPIKGIHKFHKTCCKVFGTLPK